MSWGSGYPSGAEGGGWGGGAPVLSPPYQPGWVYLPGTAWLNGQGQLTATVVVYKVYSYPELAGNGSLSAPTRQVYPVAPPLGSEGTLSAGFSTFLMTPQFSGGGTLYGYEDGLSATAFPYDAAALGGSGTLAGTAISQVYPFVGALSGAGALTAVPDAGHHYSDNFTGGNPAAALAGSGALSATVWRTVPAAGNLTGNGTLSATVVYAPNGPTSTEFQTAGASTYSIPWWCNHIDFIALGAGGGGQGLGFIGSWGEGGHPGIYAAATVTRGVEIAATATTINLVVGAGGAAGAGSSGGPGGAGGASSATPPTGTSISAGGGAGGSAGNNDYTGKSPGNGTYNGQTYFGGATQSTGESAGNPPGGGGSGSQVTLTDGGPGANGAVWFYAYQ